MVRGLYVAEHLMVVEPHDAEQCDADQQAAKAGHQVEELGWQRRAHPPPLGSRMSRVMAMADTVTERFQSGNVEELAIVLDRHESQKA